MAHPRENRGKYSSYRQNTDPAVLKLHDTIKHHLNAATDIESRGNPSGAKLPAVATALHRQAAKNAARKSNELTRNRKY